MTVACCPEMLGNVPSARPLPSTLWQMAQASNARRPRSASPVSASASRISTGVSDAAAVVDGRNRPRELRAASGSAGSATAAASASAAASQTRGCTSGAPPDGGRGDRFLPGLVFMKLSRPLCSPHDRRARRGRLQDSPSRSLRYATSMPDRRPIQGRRPTGERRSPGYGGGEAVGQRAALASPRRSRGLDRRACSPTAGP